MIRMEDGTIVDMNPDLMGMVIVLTEQSVGKEYYNLLRASAFLYQTIELQFKAIEQTIDLAESVGADGVVPALLQLQQGMHIGKRIALEGYESVAKSLQQPKD